MAIPTNTRVAQEETRAEASRRKKQKTIDGIVVKLNTLAHGKVIVHLRDFKIVQVETNISELPEV